MGPTLSLQFWSMLGPNLLENQKLKFLPISIGTSNKVSATSHKNHLSKKGFFRKERGGGGGGLDLNCPPGVTEILT